MKNFVFFAIVIFSLWSCNTEGPKGSDTPRKPQEEVYITIQWDVKKVLVSPGPAFYDIMSTNSFGSGAGDKFLFVCGKDTLLVYSDRSLQGIPVSPEHYFAFAEGGSILGKLYLNTRAVSKLNQFEEAQEARKNFKKSAEKSNELEEKWEVAVAKIEGGINANIAKNITEQAKKAASEDVSTATAALDSLKILRGRDVGREAWEKAKVLYPLIYSQISSAKQEREAAWKKLEDLKKVYVLVK